MSGTVHVATMRVAMRGTARASTIGALCRRLGVAGARAGWAVILASAGCASSPKVEYFALQAGAAGPPAAATTSTRVQIARVHVPPTLDRRQMVRHTGTYTVDISDQHRWSAPLDEMIRRVLTEDLIRLLPAGGVTLPNEPASTDTDKIVVDVLQFGPDASGTVRLRASWSLLPPGSHEPAQSRMEDLTEHAGSGGAADQVRAMSAALDELAARMVHELAHP